MDANLSVYISEKKLQKFHETNFLIQKVKQLKKEKEREKEREYNKEHHTFSPQDTPNDHETQRNYVEKCLLRLERTTRPQNYLRFNTELHKRVKVEETSHCYQSQLEYLRNKCSLYRMEKKIKSLQDSSSPVFIFQPRSIEGSRITLNGGHHDITDFIKRKCNLLQQNEVVQFQERIHNITGPILIADIIREGPKPSDSPDVIWSALLSKLQH